MNKEEKEGYHYSISEQLERAAKRRDFLLKRRDFLLNGLKLTGAGVIGGAALMGGLDRTVLAAPSVSQIGQINAWNQIDGVSVIVWNDSAGNSYAKDVGIGSSLGTLIYDGLGTISGGTGVTAYGAALGAGNSAGAISTTSAIQEAINACRGTGGLGGGEVKLIPGIYPTTGTINLYPAVHLSSGGPTGAFVGFGTCSIQPAAALNAPVIQVIVDPANSSLLVFPYMENFAINGVGPINTLQDGIKFSDVNGLLKDCFINNVGVFGVGGNGLHNSSALKLWISNFYTEDNLQSGILSDTSTIMRISHSYIFGNTLYGIWLNPYTEFLMDHCDIWNNTQYGTAWQGGGTAYSEVSGCAFKDNGGGAFKQLYVPASSGATTGLIDFHDNNVVEDRGSGQATTLVALGVGANAINLNFHHNNLQNNLGQTLAHLLTFNAALLTGQISIKENQGLNPLGLIANPFSASTIGLNGSLAIPTASTAYTVFCTDVFVTAANSAGANNAILIKDPAGNTTLGPVSTLTFQYVPRGYSINWGAFTGAAGAVSVWGV